MSTSASPSSSSSRRSDAVALLTLAGDGQVLQASAAAGALWETSPDMLVGRPFTSLFRFEVVSDDPAMLEAQWDILTTTATEQRVPLSALPVGTAGTAPDETGEDPPTIEVRVALEPAGGGEARWFATVAPGQPAAAETSVTPAPIAEGNGAVALLTRSDAAGFFDLNFATGETHYSPAWKQLLGYAPADLADNYDTWLKLIHPDDSAAAPDQVGRHTGSPRRSFSVEFRMKHRRGNWVWLQSIGVQLFDDSGELTRVVGFHLDVSERKEIEELGVVAEDRLEQLTGSGGVAVFDLDFVNGRAWTSAAWQELSGSPVEHPEIGTFTQHLPDAQGDLALFLSNFGGNESWGSGPATLRRSDRRDTPILLGLHRQVSRRGELNRVLGYAVHAPAAASRQTTPPCRRVA